MNDQSSVHSHPSHLNYTFSIVDCHGMNGHLIFHQNIGIYMSIVLKFASKIYVIGDVTKNLLIVWSFEFEGQIYTQTEMRIKDLNVTIIERSYTLIYI